MRYTVITAHTRTVPQQAWIKRRFVWKSSPPTWRISPFVFIPIFFSYLLLVKMLPLRSEVGFNPPALHPCGHLSYAVHPPGASRRTVPARINPPLLQKKKGGKTHIYHSVSSSIFSPDSGLSVCVCHRQASPHGGFITRWCVAAEGGRANERVRLVLRVRILPQGGGNHHHHHHHVLCEPTSSHTAWQHCLHLSHFWYDKCVFVVLFLKNQLLPFSFSSSSPVSAAHGDVTTMKSLGLLHRVYLFIIFFGFVLIPRLDLALTINSRGSRWAWTRKWSSQRMCQGNMSQACNFTTTALCSLLIYWAL